MYCKTIISTLLGVMVLPVMAEDNTPFYNDSITYELNPVVVTATGMHQRLKNSTLPVEVITGHEIEAAGINGLQEALTMMVPSLSFSPNAMGSYLRFNGLTNSHVLMLVNGRKMIGDISGNVDLSQIDINTIKRIEVLSGAASTLYGSDAVGGVINIITSEPTDRSEFSSSSRYTTKNRFDQGLDLSLSSGKVGSFTGYNYSHSDGWQNSPYTMEDDEMIRTLAQLSLGYTSNNLTQRFTYKPTDRLSTYAEGTYYNKCLDRPVVREDITGGSKYNNFYESWSWAGGATYRLGDLGNIKFDYTGRTYGQWYKYLVESGDYLPGQYQRTKRQKYHEAELRGFFNFSETSNTIFGIDYRHQTLIRPESDLDKGLGTFSVYGQHEQRLWNHITATAGLRYDKVHSLGSRVTPKVSLMFKAGDFNLRGTYAMGYRTPGIDEMYYHMLHQMGSRYTITLGNPGLKSETSNYGAINAEWRTARFSASVTGYVNFVKNMVTSSTKKWSALDDAEKDELMKEFPEIANVKTSSLGIKRYYNFNKANVKGVEINLSGVPCHGLQLSGNYSLAFGRGMNDDGEWQKLNRSVVHSATVTANYFRTWGRYNLNVNLNGRMQSRTYYPGDVDGNAPGYGVWNLMTRHEFDYFRSFTLTPGIGVENIFDRRDMRPLNSNFALYSPGRSVVISLNVTLK